MTGEKDSFLLSLEARKDVWTPVGSVKIAQPTSPLVQVIGISTKENRKET